jgi:cell division protein FtsL
MWEKLYSFGKDLLTLKRQVEKNATDIKELRQDLKDLTSAVDNLARVV